jgi:hypothetical protein
MILARPLKSSSPCIILDLNVRKVNLKALFKDYCELAFIGTERYQLALKFDFLRNLAIEIRY